MSGMRVTMRLVGARRARAVLEHKHRAVKRTVRGAVVDWAEAAVGFMRALAPVRKGTLRRGIQVDSVDRIPSGGWSAFVGPGSRVRHAAFVEYGTKNTPEQPYARPTRDLAAVAGPNVITSHVRSALR